MRFLSLIKKFLITPGEKARRIWFGRGCGIWFNIDLACKTQRVIGTEELEIASIVSKYSNLAKTIVDVGANDGYYTVIPGISNKDAVIYSCDPDVVMKDRCLANLKLNGLSEDKRFRYLTKFVGTSLNSSYVSLDNLLQDAKEPIFIKIDVDGPELDVLKSGENSLRQKKCYLVVETHSKDLEANCIAYLKNLSYQCKVIKNAWWRLFLPEERPIPHNRWFAASPLTNDKT